MIAGVFTRNFRTAADRGRSRRYHFGVKHGVEIAVIVASAVTERAATVAEMLRSVPANERHTSHEKWYRAAYASQNVLVYGAIPDHAVLASVPLVRVLNNLPSYCLRPRPPAESKTPPPAAIKRVSWTYLGTDANYHHFSGEKSGIFLRAAPEDAVRLALTLLGVWFVWMLHFRPPPQNEPNIFRIAAVTKVRELARAAALWPAPETRLEKGDRETRLDVGDTPAMRGLWDREVAQLVGELARLIAEETHRIPGGRTETAAAVPDSESDSDSDSESNFTKVDKEEPEDSDAKGKELFDVQLPIVLGQRNYLSMPPPTPSPHGPGARSEPKIEHEPEPEHGAGRCVETSDVQLAATAADEIPRALVSAPPEVLSARREHHSISETASALLTGFFFGALLVVALSAQRRPALLLLS
ncbi:hypothetical protein B0H14DRAFT_3558246 [Mycena olivaceomarginata]|nr:hypothetical protein B0H14DRAFT_3558246 [Mycena olivaceomarginata]